jgi:hypothetical protein
MKSSDKTLRALALIGGLGLAAVSAAAQTPVSGIIIDGTYLIDTSFEDSNGRALATGCMMQGNAGKSTVPSLYKWSGSGHYCNLDVASPQALWRIYPVTFNGVVRHVIKSTIDGKCLVRGNSGQAAQASLFLWPGNSDTRLCGLKTAADFIHNGQAAWDFSQLRAHSVTPFDYADGNILYSGAISLMPANQPRSYLMFSPMPTSSPSSTPDVSMATFSDKLTGWRLYLFSSTTVPVPVPVPGLGSIFGTFPPI